MAMKKKTTKQVSDQSVEAESSSFDESSNFDIGMRVKKKTKYVILQIFRVGAGMRVVIVR